MKLPILFLAGALCAGATRLLAQTAESLPSFTGWSSEVTVGYLLDSKAAVYTAGGGYHLTENHYLGLEVSGFSADESEIANGFQTDSKLDATMAFGVYRFRYPFGSSNRFALQAGGGLGAAWLKVDGDLPALGIHVSDKSTGDLAGELFAGAEWRLNRHVGVQVRYRYLKVFDSELFGVKSDFTEDIVEAGLTYRF